MSYVPDGRVPSQFRGMARQLRDRVAAEGDIYHDACRKLFQPLKLAYRKNRHRKIRFEVLQQACRAWANLPAFGRLDKPRMIITGRHKLDCAEIRLLPGKATYAHWDTDEPEDFIAAELCMLHVGPNACDLDFQCLAAWSLHCLGRRFQRGSRDVDGIFADMGDLVRQHASLLAAPDDGSIRRVPCPRGGQWRAEVDMTNFTDGSAPRRVVMTRTYVE